MSDFVIETADDSDRALLLAVCAWAERFLFGSPDVLDLSRAGVISDAIRKHRPTVKLTTVNSDCAGTKHDLIIWPNRLQELVNTEYSFQMDFVRGTIATFFASLKPGGHLLLAVPNITSWWSLDRIFNGRHPHTVWESQREYTPKAVRELLAAFEIERFDTINTREQIPVMRRVELEKACKRLGASVEERGDTIIVMARRP